MVRNNDLLLVVCLISEVRWWLVLCSLVVIAKEDEWWILALMV